MKHFRDATEAGFASLGRWIFNRRYLSLGLVLLFTFILVAQLGKLTIDTSNDAFYHPDDPIRVAYNEFRQQFGKDDHIYIGFTPDEVFDPVFLKQLQALHQEIEAKVPYVKSVTSLINARNTYGEEDELIVEDLLDPIPESAEALAVLRQKALANPFYQNYLISGDGRFTAIDVEPVAVTRDSPVERSGAETGSADFRYISTEEYGEMMTVLRPILEKYRDAGLESAVGGFPVVSDTLTAAITNTVATLTPLSFLLNILFLIFLFRRLSGVIYPMVIVFLSLISTIGAMAWLSIPLDLVTTILPTLLTVVGVADAVHLLSGFYRNYDRNGGDKESAIADALGRNGLAIMMTSITTSVGLLSFTVADMAPVAHLGIAAPIGILLAFVYTVLLLPALIAIFPMRRASAAAAAPKLADRLLDWVAEFTSKRYRSIIGFSGVLFLIALSGAAQLKISHDPLSWFPETSKIRHDADLIDSALGGSVPIEVVINTGKSQGLYDPKLTQRLEHSSENLMSLEDGEVRVGHVNGIHTVLREVNRALHGNDQNYYRVPESRELTAQELLLFEVSNADDLHRLVSDDYAKNRVTAMVPFVDAIYLKPVVQQVRQHFEELYPDEDVYLTGIGGMLVETVYDLLTTMVKSYAIALIAITGLMILIIGRLRIGLISMAPNLLPIALAMGVMGWMGMSFDFSNMMVGSVAIGLVVDDTIHFLHNLRRSLDRLGDVKAAVRETLHTAGRAIFITSMVLAAGMAIALTAELQSSANFGIITASAILLALLADFFLVPALMYAVFGKQTEFDQEAEPDCNAA
jgi:predicted RND superfamily exporter protein